MRRLLCLFVVVSVLLLRVAIGDDWPAFRGPQGNGWSDGGAGGDIQLSRAGGDIQLSG